MKKSFISLVLFALASSASAEVECPVQWGVADDYDVKVAAAITKSASCDEGMNIADACAMGSSIDVAIYGTAEMKCTKKFAKKPAEMKLLNQLTDRCARKYANQEGTMYRSFHSACRANVAQLMNRLN